MRTVHSPAQPDLDEVARERLEAYVRALVPGCTRYWPFEAAGTWAYLLAGLIIEATVDQAEAYWVTPAALVDLPALIHACPDEPPRRVVARYLSGERASEPPPAIPATSFSSEPLDRAGTVGRLRALAAAGVDLSLLRAQTRLTPEARIEAMMALADTCHVLQTSMAASRNIRD